jgi:hypothetical protein
MSDQEAAATRRAARRDSMRLRHVIRYIADGVAWRAV